MITVMIFLGNVITLMKGPPDVIMNRDFDDDV